MPDNGYSGLEGKVRTKVGLATAIDLDVEGFTSDIEVGLVSTNTTASAWEQAIKAKKKISGSFDFLIQLEKNPLSDAVGMMPGAATNPVLEIDIGGGMTMTGEAIIQKVSLKSNTDDAIRCTASFQGTGTWTLPVETE